MSSQSQEILQFAGQVIVDKITIYSADRQTSLDITLLFHELDLFEDIYSPTLHGSISIIDNFNLPTEFPILGEEVLEFTCHTPTIDQSIGTITKQFAITSLEEKYIKTSRSQVYILRFISLESLLDMNMRVYKAFTGTPSDSAIQVFNTYFVSKKLLVEPCSNSLKLVSPSVSPFTFMNILASKAMSSTNGFNEPTFLFYEDNKTYNFVSLPYLFNRSPVMKYRYSFNQLRTQDKTGESIRDIQAEYEQVKEIFIDQQFDMVKKTMSGALGHKVMDVDVMRKTIKSKTYSYLDDFSSASHLNKYPVNDDNTIHSNDAVLEVCITHPYHHMAFSQDRDADILTKRPPMLAQEEFIKMDIVVNGRTDIKVGDVVDFEMGKFMQTDPTVKNSKDMIDPYYSGNYLISAIHHRFTLTRHESIMQIVKDSFLSKITKQIPEK